MSKEWSKIYNNKKFFRNVDSLKILNKAESQKWTYQKTAFELFKIMNPVSNKVNLKTSFKDYNNFLMRHIKKKKIFQFQTMDQEMDLQFSICIKKKYLARFILKMLIDTL